MYWRINLLLTNVTKNTHAEIGYFFYPLYRCKHERGVKMITLSQPSNSERARAHESQRPTGVVETAGSLAMLFENGLMTMGQYDEFITNNPFAVDYSMYSTFDGGADIAYSGFLSDFSNAVSTLGDMGGGGFVSAGFSGDSCGGGSCGGFTSFC